MQEIMCTLQVNFRKKLVPSSCGTGFRAYGMKTPERWRPSRIVASFSVLLAKDVTQTDTHTPTHRDRRDQLYTLDRWRRREKCIPTVNLRRCPMGQVRHLSGFLGHLQVIFLFDSNVQFADRLLRTCKSYCKRHRLSTLSAYMVPS